jgi:hypothetical protein
MIQLGKSLQAWGTPEFASVLKQEIEQASAEQLPLQQGLSLSSSVADTPFTVVIHGASEQSGMIRVKAAILYQGMIGGCSCAGDPTPDNEIDEHCEVQLDIDRATAVATVSLLADD